MIMTAGYLLISLLALASGGLLEINNGYVLTKTHLSPEGKDPSSSNDVKRSPVGGPLPHSIPVGDEPTCKPPPPMDPKKSKNSEEEEKKEEKENKQPELGPCGGFENQLVQLFNATSKALARCNGCGSKSKYSDSGTVHAGAGGGYAAVTMSAKGDKCVLKSDNGKFMGTCPGCWLKSPDIVGVFPYITDPEKETLALWTVKKDGDEFLVISSDGKYLSSCQGCLSGAPNLPIARADSTTPDVNSRWKIMPAPAAKAK